jgi:hypothetical protein
LIEEEKELAKVAFSNQDTFRIWLKFIDEQDRVEAEHGDVACKSAPDFFFPETNENMEYTKATCRACPLVDACATYAIYANEREGIWGGLSTRERQNVRREVIKFGNQAFFIENGFAAYKKFRLESDRRRAKPILWEGPL